MTPELWDWMRIVIGFGAGFVGGFTVCALFVISGEQAK